MTNPTEESKQQIQKITEDFLQKLHITGNVTVNTDETDAYRVHINTDETGVLIGHHGKTLESFQLMLGFIVTKAFGSWQKVYVNVGDYREKREESLMYMAQRTADRVVETRRPIELSNLSSAERRVIHLTLSGDERVETESYGEGENRILVVKPKNSSSVVA
ncbi:MAG: KH domain-containing protein [Patescibacteria group bacterium]|nr:KH domain-containing protein [Patescibacteria group bacterium]